ncbi:MAG: LysM peptidoglycan-binding domain-containing protein [Candidatus Absconditabacterales bacterium]
MINLNRLNYAKFILTLILIGLFVYVIVYADKFSQSNDQLSISVAFIQGDNGLSPEMDINTMTVQIDNNENGMINYTVQTGDTLLKIASMFGTTVSNIKQHNKIDGAPAPLSTLIIINDDQGFLYTINEKTNIVVFANKYNLNLQDLMTLNYIQDESELLYPGQEIFVNITKEKAYDLGLLVRPKPVIVYQPKYRPVINKPQKYIVKTNIKTISQNTQADKIIETDINSKIISKRTYTKKINNKFYPGYCTWYAAIITPQIFPYIDDKTQDRPFGGDAQEWCKGAKNAGFKTGKTPAIGALIVYYHGGARNYQAGHVGKVINYYPDDDKLIVRDMNYIGKFVVTERWEETDNSNIQCYIYPGK